MDAVKTVFYSLCSHRENPSYSLGTLTRGLRRLEINIMRDSTHERNNLHTVSGYEKAKRRVFLFCRRWHSVEYSEDFTSWLITEWLSGKRNKQQLKHSLIDYQLEARELTRPSLALNKGYQSRRPSYLEDLPEWEKRIDQGDIQDTTNHSDLVERLVSNPSINQKELFLLLDSSDGWTMAECAILRGVTESRICQIQTRAIKKIKDLETIRTARELLSEPTVTVFEIDWITF